MTIIADNLSDLYRLALSRVLTSGDHVRPRDMQTRELRSVTLQLTNPLANLVVSPARKANYAFGIAEFMWIMSGQNDVETIAKFNKQMGNFSDDGTYMKGAYGPKVVEQLPYIEETLRKDPNSRQAVLTIWRERPGPTKDVPCTSLFQFFVRNGALELTTFMRSNDLWLGFPYDVYDFTMIQNYLAHRLGVRLGTYTHCVGSLHVYEHHWESAHAVIQEQTTWRPESLPFASDFGLRERSCFLNIAAYGEQLTTPLSPEWAVLMSVLAARFNPQQIVPPTFQGLRSGRTNA
jgi:thymidylate synthase